jgi:hypothetical protein
LSRKWPNVQFTLPSLRATIIWKMNAANQHGRVPSTIRPSTRNTKRGCSDSGCFESQSSSTANFHKINRNINLIESVVSHSKQRTAPQINRNNSRWSPARPIPSIFCFLFFTGTKINRKPGLIELLVSHSKQRTGPKINRKLSCTVCPDAGRESATVRRSTGSGSMSRLHNPKSGVKSRTKCGDGKFRHGGHRRYD